MSHWVLRSLDVSPAGRIIRLLSRRGPMAVAELVADTGATTTAVREQVNRLVGEGRLIRRVHRNVLARRGRPPDLLNISDQGRRLFGHRLQELSANLVARGQPNASRR